MSVKIRMKKMGSKKRPFFRIVAADARSPRDGRFIEQIGYYNPLTEPADIKIDEDKLYKWLDDGAVPSGNVVNLLKQLGLLERWQLLKSGVAIQDLDRVIEERRAKQPKAKPKEKVKLSKKAAAKAEEEKKSEGKEEPEEAAPPAREQEEPAESAGEKATEESGEEVEEKADTAEDETKTGE